MSMDSLWEMGIEGGNVIPANEKDFQIHWRSQVYTGDKFGKS